MADLANQTDATAFGYGTILSGMFARASARVRGYTRQTLSAATTTDVVRGPIVQLPQRPVNSVTSVTALWEDGSTTTLAADEWELRPGGVLETPNYGCNLSVVYSSGWATIPDEVKELVCGIASRLGNIQAGAASGVQQETGGSESVTYGFDSYNAIAELTTGEKRVLDRLFPRRAAVVVMRSGSASLPASMTRF